MPSAVTLRKCEVWERRGNNWRKGGRAIPKGTTVTGTVNGEYFYLASDRRTKKIWLKLNPVVVPPVDPPPVVYPEKDYYMVPHDRMRVSYDIGQSKGGWKLNPSRNGEAREAARNAHSAMPEVYRVQPAHVTKLTPAWVDLLVAINPDLTEQNARDLLNTGLAWCNAHYGEFDFSRLCGGAIVSGQKDAINKYVYINSYRVDDPVPTAAEMLADPSTWYWATGVQPDGDINYIQYMGKDGQRHPCRMFIVSKEPLYIPVDELLYIGTKYPANYDPRAMR